MSTTNTLLAFLIYSPYLLVAFLEVEFRAASTVVGKTVPLVATS